MAAYSRSRVYRLICVDARQYTALRRRSEVPETMELYICLLRPTTLIVNRNVAVWIQATRTVGAVLADLSSDQSLLVASQTLCRCGFGKTQPSSSTLTPRWISEGVALRLISRCSLSADLAEGGNLGRLFEWHTAG